MGLSLIPGEVLHSAHGGNTVPIGFLVTSTPFCIVALLYTLLGEEMIYCKIPSVFILL